MRDKLYEMQKAYDPDSVPDERPSFAVFSASHREMTAKIANNKRKSVQAAKTLAEAAEEVERIAKIPVIKNADALGLQVLADLANRPVIRNFLPPPVAQTWRPEVVQAPTNTTASTPSKAMSGHGTPVKPPSSHGRVHHANQQHLANRRDNHTRLSFQLLRYRDGEAASASSYRLRTVDSQNQHRRQ